MKRLIFLALFVLFTASLTTFTSSLTANDYKFRMQFAMDTTDANDINFIFLFPQTTNLPPPPNFQFEVFDSSGASVFTSPVLTVVFSPTTPMGHLWTSPLSSQRYTVEVRGTNPATTMVPFTIRVQSSSTLYIPGQYAAPYSSFTDPVDILRNSVLKGIYVNADGPVAISHSLGTNLISVFSDILNADLTAPITSYTDSGTTRTYTLTKGYYAIKFEGSAAATISYQSDSYTCPALINFFNDINRILEPCHLVEKTEITSLAANRPRFDLLSVGRREVIEIVMKFPITVGGVPDTYFLRMLAQDGSVLIQPADFGASGASAITAAMGQKSFFWTAPYAGNFILEVVSQLAGDFAAVNPYYLMVTRANGGTLVQAVDILRPETIMIRYINVEFPAPFTLFHSQSNSHINLYQATVPYTLITPATPVTPASTPTSFQKFYPITTAGNYLAIITANSITDTITIKTSSNTYLCPYDPASTFIDVRGTFNPCTDQLNAAPALTPAPVIPVIPANHIPVYGDSLNQFANMTDTQPRHDIGSIVSGDVFTFHIYFRLQTNLNPLTFRLQIVGAQPTFTPLGTQPTGFQVDQTIGAAEPAHFTFTWTPTVTGQHYIEVFTTATTTTHPESLRIYELRAQKIAAGSSSTSILFQETGILRKSSSTPPFLYNLIFLEKISTITVRHSIAHSGNFELFSMETTNFLLNNNPVVLKTGTASSTIALQYTLPAGYYGLGFKYDTTPVVASVSFQSNSYACPYTSGVNDIRGDFDPCTGSIISNAPANLHQAYVIQAHGCSPTQFFNGTCNNVDPAKKCNTFNALSGDCTTCYSTKYDIVQGSCVILPTCSSGFTLVGAVCVSDLCKDSDPQGLCTSCKSVLNEVKSDGTCGLKACSSPAVLNSTTGNCDTPVNNCEPGFYQVVPGQCYKLPPNCAALEATTLSIICARCSANFTFSNGHCVPCRGPNSQFPCRTCPNRFFLNSQAVCTKVSNQCRDYNPDNGLCTSCRSGTPRNGVCCPPGLIPQGQVCITLGGGGATAAGAGGGVSISFLESAFFQHCADADNQRQVCNYCKPGYTFIRGNLCG